jgi:hypothetical protein
METVNKLLKLLGGMLMGAAVGYFGVMAIIWLVEGSLPSSHGGKEGIDWGMMALSIGVTLVGLVFAVLVHLILHEAGHLIAEIEKAIEECDKEMRRLIMEDEELKENFEIITSIKGVALQNATGLIVYTNNFRKFDFDARKIACYYGVAPFGKTSGTSVKSQPHVSKLANRMLKSLLSEAAKCAIRFCDEIRDYYTRMIANGKKHGVAINNVRNKMIRIIVAMVRDKQKYNPCYRLQTIYAGQSQNRVN